MFFNDRTSFCWFFGLCGGRRRRQRWQQASERDVTSPVQPKTARFYGVHPLFPEPSPIPASRPMSMSTLSECGTESSKWQSESTLTYSESERSTVRSQIFGGEKLERWLGESLKTIPEDGRPESEDGRPESEDGCGSRPRTYLLSISSPATTSYGPSTDTEEFELIVQGTSDMSVAGRDDLESDAESTYCRPQTSYTNATGQGSRTATFLLDESYTSSHEAIQHFLAAMRRHSADCSSVTSEFTEGASWIFRPLQPAPKSNSPQGFYDFQTSSGSRERSNSNNSRTEMSEISTELAFASVSNSEYGEQRIVLRRMHSSSTFRSRFSRWGDRNSRASIATDTAPAPPMPSAQIPRRTVSIRAVRRKLLEPPATGNLDCSLFTPLRDQPSPQEQGCQCPSSDPEVRMAGEPAACDVSRVHHWVSGRQQQFQVNPAQPSEFLVQFMSRYPTEKPPKQVPESYTSGGKSSTGADVGTTQSGEGEDYVFRLPRLHMCVHNDEDCPCENATLMPVYQEVDPNPMPTI